MKKLINRPENFVKETMEGIIYAYGDKVKLLDGCNFSYRIQIKATSNPYNSLNPLTWSESP